MTTQEQYEMDNSPELKRAKELKEEGHTHLCAAVMVRGDDCICNMEGWICTCPHCNQKTFNNPCGQCGEKRKEGKR